MFRNITFGLSIIALVTLASADDYYHSEFFDLLHHQDHSGTTGIDISPFVDPLPIPQTIKVSPGTKQITMTLGLVKNKFYKKLPVTNVWGYNGSSPGPTVEVQSGQALEILWKNNLPKTHLIPSDGSPMPGMPGGTANLPAVRNVTHLHGAAVTETNLKDRFHNNDGWPDNWTVPGETQISEYPNPQSARMLWYHDHAMGTTSRNVNAGLVGMYLIRDAYERSLNLPTDQYEIPLLFQTHDFNDNGSLAYPSKISGEVYGSSISVNGKIWPYLNVEPRKYRFRIVNATNARSLAMKLLDVKDQSSGPAFFQIGTDSGFLHHTAVLNDPALPENRLNLAPAERADIIVDFSKSAGKTFLLENNNTGDTGDAELYLPNLLIFKVGVSTTGTDTSQIPMSMAPIAPLTGATTTRNIVISQVDTPNSPPVMMLNEKAWDDPITETVKLNSTEIWQIVNTLPDGHPFHVHLVQFQILDRRPYDVAAFEKTRQIVFTAPPIAPNPNEMGWKDTVLSNSGQITRIIAKFGPYPGKFVFHCHILEHEDMGMMRPFEVVP